MSDTILDAFDGPQVPIHAMTEADAAAVLDADALAAGLAKTAEFKGKSGQVLLIHDSAGALDRVLYGLGEGAQPDNALRMLPAKLPAGVYIMAAAPGGVTAERVALAWALGSYRFDRYKGEKGRKAATDRPRLVAEGADIAEVRNVAHACALARDMVNTPANDMGPRQIETIAREIAGQHAAQVTVIEGEGLLEANYPAVHAVGRAADPARAPRMIEISWGHADKPLVCIIGKGVVFDTGGLDIKASAGMRLMKKDMGGAAHALALGRMIMAARLPVRLVVLTPVVENAISGDAMRPGDVLASRKGLSIEVGNTDEIGRAHV